MRIEIIESVLARSTADGNVLYILSELDSLEAEYYLFKLIEQKQEKRDSIKNPKGVR